MAITLEQIKSLRKRTGVGVGAVKEALEASKGDEDKAIEILREKGLAKGANRAGKTTENGIVVSYIHAGGSIGVLVELAAETDFATRSQDFQDFGKDIAMHIAASKPLYIEVDNIPADLLEKEKKAIEKELGDSLKGKPEDVKSKIIEGKLQKYYSEVVLVEQSFVKDESKKVKDLLGEALAKIGENIQIARFARFEIAQPANSCGIDEV